MKHQYTKVRHGCFLFLKKIFSLRKSLKVFPDFSIIGFGVIAIIRQNFVSGDIGANSY